MTSAKKVECVLNREGNVTPQVSHPHRAHRAAEEYPMTFWSSTPLDYLPSISCTPPPFHYVFDTQTIGSLLARTSSQIPTIKTTSLADLQSSLFDICKIINDLNETVNNLNGVIIICTNWKVSKHCLFVFGAHWSVYLAYYLLPHRKKKRGKESEKAPLWPRGTGSRYRRAESSKEFSSKSAKQDSRRWGETLQCSRSVMMAIWIAGCGTPLWSLGTHLKSRKFCSGVEQIPVRHS